MELGPEWVEAGLWGLFFASFLSATILPFSSEAVLGAMAMGSWSGHSLLWVASIGNTLGGLTNYAIGRWIPQERLLKRFRIDRSKAERWHSIVARHGSWVACFCWLPIIGDPLALALGVLRMPFVPVSVLMFVGKALRYAVVLWLIRGSLG